MICCDTNKNGKLPVNLNAPPQKEEEEEEEEEEKKSGILHMEDI